MLLLTRNNPSPQSKILDCSKSKHDIIKSDKSELKFFGMKENIVGKGGNARFQRFLHSPQCFKKNFR